MAIGYYTEGTEFVLPQKGKTALWLRGVVEAEGLRLGAVNFIFCSPERHLDINRRFLGHDYRTDVITFEYADGGTTGVRGTAGPSGVGARVVCGDIFIDPGTVGANAADHFAAPQVEMRRVMVHGVLHLCGYGDKTPRQRKKMRERENFYLARYYGNN